MAPKAVLIGLPGSGKSTIGRRLAKSLGVSLLDTDTAIEQTTGRTIPEIFTNDGEQEFRRIEEEVVRDALVSHDGVLSLGGGAITSPGVREALSGHTVIYLEISATEGVRRTGGTTVRPLLAGGDRAEKFRALMSATGPALPEGGHDPGQHQPPQSRRGGALHRVAAGEPGHRGHPAQTAAAPSPILAPHAGVVDAEPVRGHHPRQPGGRGPPRRGST